MTTPITTRAPTRIDFGGGWTDVPPYSDEMGGFVCNVAIARYATVTVKAASPGSGITVHVDRPGMESLVRAAATRVGTTEVDIQLQNDFPVSAGLGGSSAANVAVLAALLAHRRQPTSPSALAELSREVEIDDLGIAGGRQDHYAAAYGGALGLRFTASGVSVSRIPLPGPVRRELEGRCLVMYTGQSRISDTTIKAVLGGYRDGDERVRTCLAGMRELAVSMADALAVGDVDRLADLVAEQWTYQRQLHPAIPTPAIDAIVERAHAAGARGSKALGASGGGCVLVIAERGKADAVRAAIAPLGELLAFTLDESGVVTCP